MTFSRLTKMKLFDELLDRRQKGQRCPSLGWIAKHSRLADADQAEALLREMARDNVVTILRMGPFPWVSLKRLTYGGAIVSEMTLDPERFDQFTDGNDVLVVKAAPDPLSLPSAVREDDIEDLVEAVEKTVRVPVKRPIIPENIPEVRSVEQPSCAVPAANPEQTEHVALTTATQSVEARQPAPLLAEVEAFLTRTGMAPTTFGKRALENSMFVTKLRNGLDPHGKTVDRARRYMADYQPPARASTFKCGHPRTPENSHENGHGYKRCKECSSILKRNWKRAKVAAAEIPLIGRPHVRTAVLRQWEAEGRPPLNAFLTDLLDLGLEARTTFRSAA